MKLYRFSMLIIFLLIIAVAIVTTMQILHGNGVFKGSEAAGKSIDFLYGVIILILLVTFCIAQIICLFTRKFNVNNLGFFMLHTGLVLFLIGSFIYKSVGISEMMDMPVDGMTYQRLGIRKENYTKMVDLGFFIGVNDFKVDKYDPIYDLYKRNESGEWKRVMHDVEPDDNGMINFKEYGSLNEDVYKDLGDNTPTYAWSGDLLVLKRQPDKYYEANLIVHDLSGKNKKEVKLIANKPYRRNGWIVYLMSYNPDRLNPSIKLLFKYDPSEIISQAGIWLIITGSFVMCFASKRMKQGGRKNG